MGLDKRPKQMTGGPIFSEALNREWYLCVRENGEIVKWPSNAAKGEPESEIPVGTPVPWHLYYVSDTISSDEPAVVESHKT